MIERIFTQNAAFQKLEALKTNRNKRHKLNEFIVEGVRNINESIKNNWVIVSFIYSKDIPLSDWAKNTISKIKTNINYELTSKLMEKISEKEDTSELMAIVKIKNNDINDIKLSENPIIALFDRPAKKANLGTVIRSCDALGIEMLIITGHSADVYDPRCYFFYYGILF